MQQAVTASRCCPGEVGAPIGDVSDSLASRSAEPEGSRLHDGRSFLGSFATTASYEASMASNISSSGIAPPVRSDFQPEPPMYAITDASSGYLASHSFAISRLEPY